MAKRNKIMAKKIPDTKYSVTPKINPKGKAMPVTTPSKQMKTKIDTTSDATKSKGGGKKK